MYIDFYIWNKFIYYVIVYDIYIINKGIIYFVKVVIFVKEILYIVK